MKMKMVWMVVALMAAACVAKAEDAKAAYDKSCAMCHGKDGKADTPAGKKVGAKDFTDAAVQSGMKDEEMCKSIKEGIKKDGKTVMKAYGDKLTDQEIKDLVAYVRAFKK